MKLDIKHLAKLANLPLDKTQEEKFTTQLTGVLEHFKKLSELSIEAVEETSQVTGLKNVARNDETSASLSQKSALSNAKNVHDNLFIVPAVIDETTQE